MNNNTKRSEESLRGTFDTSVKELKKTWQEMQATTGPFETWNGDFKKQLEQLDDVKKWAEGLQGRVDKKK